MTSSGHAHLDRQHYDMARNEPASDVAELGSTFLVQSVQARKMN